MRQVIGVALIVAALTFAPAGAAFGAIIDFAGGTATLSDASTVTTTNTGLWHNVDYYVESGIKVDFIGDVGIIGNYYGSFGDPIQNSVIHGHWGAAGGGSLTSVVFSKLDGSTMDLNYVDITSNTVVGGGAASGSEFSQITTSGGYSLVLPSSDWGINVLSNGTTPGDGVQRMWLDSNFDNITSFTFTTQNAYCFGMDNFYIDEPAPRVPVPGSLMLTGIGLAGLARFRKRRERNA